MNAKRYNLGGYHSMAVMVEAPRGRYVKFTDYEAKCADYERLRDALEKYQWVSVSERLPDMWREVLMSHNYHSSRSEEIGFLCEGGDWQLVRTGPCDDAIILTPELVTHWMELPPPPAAVGNEVVADRKDKE